MVRWHSDKARVGGIPPARHHCLFNCRKRNSMKQHLHLLQNVSVLNVGAIPQSFEWILFVFFAEVTDFKLRFSLFDRNPDSVTLQYLKKL